MPGRSGNLDADLSANIYALRKGLDYLKEHIVSYPEQRNPRYMSIMAVMSPVKGAVDAGKGKHVHYWRSMADYVDTDLLNQYIACSYELIHLLRRPQDYASQWSTTFNHLIETIGSVLADLGEPLASFYVLHASRDSVMRSARFDRAAETRSYVREVLLDVGQFRYIIRSSDDGHAPIALKELDALVTREE